uniref:Uncharacterized protein n=1 Tax=Oryza barthii TaxID=65489 RepID=A0A0D3HRR1_9ORYZ
MGLASSVDSAPLLGAGAGAGGDHRDGAAAGAAHLGATFLASKFAKNTKKSAAAHHGKARMEDVSSIKFPKLAKPDEPDFSLSSDDVL